jgi:hypothetical protein
MREAKVSSLSRVSMRSTTSGGRLGALLNEPSKLTAVVRVVVEVVSMTVCVCMYASWEYRRESE